jgi:hypothetical protein
VFGQLKVPADNGRGRLPEGGGKVLQNRR